MASTVRLILSQDVPSLGTVGDVVNVRGGYARNFLLPRGMALVANERNKAAMEHHRRILEKKRMAMLAEAKKLASAIEKTSVTVSKQVGDEEKIFGSVTTAELEALLNKEGINIDKRNITILDDIKKVGVYTAQVKLHPEVAAKFKVWVVAQ